MLRSSEGPERHEFDDKILQAGDELADKCHLWGA
jgi:hypothetical protein